MDLYDILLFGHIACAIVWLGGGFMLTVMGIRAERAGSAAALGRVLDDMAALGGILFMPASLATLAFGIGLMIVGPWSFADFWVILGLAGIASTIVIGTTVLKPVSERLSRMVAAEGLTAAAVADMGRLARIGRIDAVVLFMVVADMALKPALTDYATLAAMAAVLLALVALILTRPFNVRPDIQPAG